MKMRRSPRSVDSGFTLVEILAALAVFSVVGILIASFTMSESWLFAKNTAVNSSHRSVRRALDRLANELQQTQNLPVLIDTAGATTTNATAPGLAYDRLLASPYKVNHPGGLGLKGSTLTMSVTRSTDPLASPALPQAGDIFLLDQPQGPPVRAQVAGYIVGAVDPIAKLQTLTLTLSRPLGNDVFWDPAQTKTAPLVRRQAFLVMPAGSRSELRFYQNFEPIPALNDPSNYTVITSEVSTFKLPDGTLRDVTPFSIDTSTNDKLVKASLRMQAKDYSVSLANKQSNSFNTFVQIDVTLPSRLRPKS